MQGGAESIRNPHAPVLFVDDDPMAHKVMKKHLEDWDIRFAESAKQALEIMERENILIVITDIRMPDMDGIELLREIKRTRGIVQVIIVTASEEVEDLVLAMEAGANDFLLKPLRKANIEEALENTMAKMVRWREMLKTLFMKKKTGAS